MFPPCELAVPHLSHLRNDVQSILVLLNTNVDGTRPIKQIRSAHLNTLREMQVIVHQFREMVIPAK